jgi:hypothetical protein
MTKIDEIDTVTYNFFKCHNFLHLKSNIHISLNDSTIKLNTIRNKDPSGLFRDYELDPEFSRPDPYVKTCKIYLNF